MRPRKPRSDKGTKRVERAAEDVGYSFKLNPSKQEEKPVYDFLEHWLKQRDEQGRLYSLRQVIVGVISQHLGVQLPSSSSTLSKDALSEIFTANADMVAQLVAEKLIESGLTVGKASRQKKKESGLDKGYLGNLSKIFKSEDDE
jgi:hypothetical protein